MPLEIKELHITARVNPVNERAAPALNQGDVAKLKQSIVRDVVREVLKQLEQKRER